MSDSVEDTPCACKLDKGIHAKKTARTDVSIEGNEILYKFPKDYGSSTLVSSEIYEQRRPAKFRENYQYDDHLVPDPVCTEDRLLAGWTRRLALKGACMVTVDSSAVVNKAPFLFRVTVSSASRRGVSYPGEGSAKTPGPGVRTLLGSYLFLASETRLGVEGFL